MLLHIFHRDLLACLIDGILKLSSNLLACSKSEGSSERTLEGHT